MQQSQLTSLQRNIVWIVFIASLSCLAGAVFLPAPAHAQIPLVIPPPQTTNDTFSSSFNLVGEMFAAAAEALPAPAMPQPVHSLAAVNAPKHQEAPFFALIENGVGQISDTLSEKFANLKPSYVHLVYARDYSAEAAQRLSKLQDLNGLLSRTNENILALYAGAGEKFLAAAAVDADAAKIIADATVGSLARVQANLSISAAAAIDDGYNSLADALESKKVSDASISVASVAYAPSLQLTLNLSL